MQNNGNSPDFPTSNPFSEHFAKFGNTRLFDRLQNKFTPKPYYYQYRTLRAVVLGASFLFHLLSAATAAALVFLFVGKLIPSHLAAGAVTLAALAALEISKRETSGRFFHDALQFGKLSPGLLVVVLALAAVSTACSFFGAERAVRALTPPPDLLAADTVTAPVRAQIAAIDGQIADAQKNTWQGKLTTRAQKTVERLTRQREALTNELIRQQTRTDTRNDATETEHATTTEANASGFALFTLCCEALLILCLWFLQYYDYRAFAEYCGKPTGKQPETSGVSAVQAVTFSTNGHSAANGHHSANGATSHNLRDASARAVHIPVTKEAAPPLDVFASVTRPRDNAAVTTGEPDPFAKDCEQCGQPFAAKVAWQRFCCEACKLAHHEAKHGRKFDPTYKRKPKPVSA